MPQIKKILVPTDFSENASAAYKFARNTAESYGAKVDFIHIIPQLHYFNVNLSSMDLSLQGDNMYPNLKKYASKKLKEEMERHIKPENRGEAIAEIENRPSRGISDYAKNNDCDLILMASRGRHNSEFLRGSVTEKVVRIAQTPVLTINKAYNPEIKTIVLPSDGSKLSMEALPIALLIANHRNAEIRFLTVSEKKDIESGSQTVEKVKQKLFSTLKEFVADSSNQLSFENESDISLDSDIKLKNADGATATIKLEVIKGKSAHRSIVDYTKEHAQLVVMGTHGRSGFANYFLGSTAEKVVRHVKMPVLTVRPEFALKQN
jgi:nucleotide-binding universal stress UspA family protein